MFGSRRRSRLCIQYDRAFMAEPVDDLAGHDLFEAGESVGGLGVATAVGIGERIVKHELRLTAFQDDRLEMRRAQDRGRISDPVDDG